MLEVNDLCFSFNSTEILRQVKFTLERSETLSILGPSGCGKSTLLKCIAGILKPASGSISLNGVSMNHIHLSKRNIIYLFQEPLLFPHLNVFENIAFGLKARKMDRTRVNDLTTQMIRELFLEGHEHKMPDEISGGQKQRVSFGRAAIINPAVMLLDEPFGNLDAQTRLLMQDLYKSIARNHHITGIFVTHDVREAISMGTRLAFMDKGELHVYPDKRSFIADPKTGAMKELKFWTEILETDSE